MVKRRNTEKNTVVILGAPLKRGDEGGFRLRKKKCAHELSVSSRRNLHGVLTLAISDQHTDEQNRDFREQI